MKIYHSLDEIDCLHQTIVTSGTFDGVHLGHVRILKRLVQLAKSEMRESVVITFWPHPRFILHNDEASFGLLSTLEEKLVAFKEIGIDHVLVIPFTKAFSLISSSDFVNNILVKKLDVKKLVIGYDHKFGQNREGGFEYLKENSKEFGFEVEEIPREDIENIGISSTKIRQALESGDVELASKFLGRHYSLSGEVVLGKQLGRTIGFPTANINVSDSSKLIPLDGVYGVHVEVGDQHFNGLMNIGNRPTVNGLNRTIEVHLLDFEGDLYDQKIEVVFICRIRAEQKFAGLEELKNQIQKDKEQAISLFSLNP